MLAIHYRDVYIVGKRSDDFLRKHDFPSFLFFFSLSSRTDYRKKKKLRDKIMVLLNERDSSVKLSLLADLESGRVRGAVNTPDDDGWTGRVFSDPISST